MRIHILHEYYAIDTVRNVHLNDTLILYNTKLPITNIIERYYFFFL